MTTRIITEQDCSIVPGDLDRMEAVYGARSPLELERHRAYLDALYPERVWSRINPDVVEANRRHFNRGGD